VSPVLRSAVGLLAFLPALALAILAVPRLEDGIANERAIPVPNSLIRESALRPEDYRRAATVLANVDAHDGDSQVLAAETEWHAGAPAAVVAAKTEAALTYAPASLRGWLLLAEVASNPARQAAALSQTFVLAPYDYYIARRRTRDAARQWDTLDADTRDMALRQVQLLWDDEALHPLILPMLQTDADGALVGRAFAQRRSDLRSLNRWVSAERRRLAVAP
jgi:hypothetical protein